MHHDILKEITATWLDAETNIGLIFSQAQELHKLLSSITNIGAHNVSTDKDIFLPTGKAIGPGGAAHCLLEAYRTAVFVRGIHDAIRQLQTDFPGQRLHILYAGCGPYATLLLPLTSVFKASEIAIHLMDINPISLGAAQSLFATLGLSEYIADTILADASVYETGGKEYHLMISETMQQALKKEPQVSIMQNLVPQLAENGIFIPQEIKVSAQLLNHKNEMEGFVTEGLVPERIHLGDVYAIGQLQLRGHQPTTVAIPPNLDTNHGLYLMTDITVYGNHHLTAYNCSLNLPVRILNANEHTGRAITFRYETGSVPGFRHELN
jgi:predicted RNA methylase